MNGHRSQTLGSEIARLRKEAGYTLRGFAGVVGISPSFLSDIERNRRRPSAEVLRTIVDKLRHVGADFEELDRLNPRVDLELQRWVDETPEVRQMLRTVRSSGRDPRELLRKIEAFTKDDIDQE